MGLKRYAAKRDLGERAIIDALEAAGCTVQQLSIKGVPDLLVGCNHWETGLRTNYLMEVKGDKGKLTKDELEWIEAWRGQVHIVRSVEQALKIIGRT